MLNTLLCALIICIIAAGAYYAAHYIVSLRHNRNEIADELTRAETHIKALEEENEMLRYERTAQDELKRSMKTEDNTGWNTFQARG
jgi:cell division protein FtsL